MTTDALRALLPPRKADGNKGTFGKVMLLAGNGNMRGAAALAALGALRLGAGLVTVASTKEVIDALSSSIYEAIWLDREKEDAFAAASLCKAVGIGPGLGQSEATLFAVRTLLAEKTDIPLVIDADGINILCGNTDWLKTAARPVLLTPHPLEFARLTGRTVAEVQADRKGVAEAFAKEYGATLLLKGKNTVITNGTRTVINESGNTALAKGGSGDVLTGMLCAFLAQGCAPMDAAVLAAHLHGLAGERLSETYSEYGVLASELPATAAKLLAELV